MSVSRDTYNKLRRLAYKSHGRATSFEIEAARTLLKNIIRKGILAPGKPLIRRQTTNRQRTKWVFGGVTTRSEK